MEKLRLNNLDSTVKSSYRTLALFEFFAEYKNPATVGEICSALNIPQSSTSTILKSLVDISFLSYDPNTRKFEPTMRMAFLSKWKMDQNKNAARIPQILEAISNTLEENVVLALRNGIYSQYLIVDHFDIVLERHVETGSVRPLVTSATGWSLLTDETDYDIGKIVRRTSHEIEHLRDNELLQSCLKHIQVTREKGYAFSEGTTAKNTAGIAMAIPNRPKIPSLAIAVAGKLERIREKEKQIASLLKETISQVAPTITQEILNLN